MNKHFYADLGEEMDEEVYRHHRPRQMASEHRIRKMRQEKEEGRRKRQTRRRMD